MNGLIVITHFPNDSNNFLLDSIISMFIKKQNFDKVIEYYEHLKKDKIEPSEILLNSILIFLSKRCNEDDIKKMYTILDEMEQKFLKPSQFLNSIIMNNHDIEDINSEITES